ncbi:MULTISPECIES: type IX secretion system membrane protein PorP/SprF [Flavobacterium]|uniref:PorP/SprF family type IX secretion system membrane protein n=1 Tax=Flavobacterium TaxID=237 RepID=UPI0021149E4B|nr:MULTISPECIES: type IX secretion system membrane protein PorP/SprF [Flavobacterium]UUF12408.1 type IX secretion system membrane protein PorP/SprF [Flavobacterium panici]
MKYIQISLFIILLSNTIFAQQDAQFSQYMYNTQVVNPAYAGSRQVLSLNGVHRSQWAGVEGAPTTQTISVNAPVSARVGLGFSVVNDKINPSKEISSAVDFSYTIPVNDYSDTKFSFGLKGGINSLNIDYSKLNIYDPNDTSFQQNVNRLSPIIGLGGYLHNDRWYIGLSVPNLLKTDYYDDIAVSSASERVTFYAIGGYVFDLNYRLKFKPAVLFKMTSGAPLAADVSFNFLLDNKFTFGVSYRMDAAISVLAGFQISKGLMIGYAYDFDTTEFSRYNSGSHEIFLRYEFFNKNNGKVSPRFF